MFLQRWCLVAASALVLYPQARGGAQTNGFVYVMTNQPAGNTVIQYARASDGSLTRLREVATGGLGGTGNGVGALDPLGSQDSVVLAPGGSFLLAVNAGSDQISSFRAGSAGLALVSTIGSNGDFPSSVAVNGNLVYVLNAHSPNIAAFHLLTTGELQPISGAVFPIPGGTAAKPHDIRFSPDGTRVIVTVEGPNEIDIFALGNNGLVTGVTRQPSAGLGPFGFKFARTGVLVVAEANSASASSYQLTAADTLQVISAAVPDGQTATCWISLTGDAKFGFVSNTASGTVSTYHISGSGTLDLASAVTATLNGGAPIDSAFSSDSAFFYVVDSALGRVVSFRVSGGSLHPLSAVTGLPTTLQGIAAQ